MCTFLGRANFSSYIIVEPYLLLPIPLYVGFLLAYLFPRPSFKNVDVGVLGWGKILCLAERVIWRKTPGALLESRLSIVQFGSKRVDKWPTVKRRIRIQFSHWVRNVRARGDGKTVSYQRLKPKPKLTGPHLATNYL